MTPFGWAPAGQPEQEMMMGRGPPLSFSSHRAGTEKFCCICHGESQAGGVMCANDHLIDRGCLDHYITVKCNAVITNPSVSSRIACPVSNNCGVYSANQLRKGASLMVLQLLEQVERVEQEFAKLPAAEQLRRANEDSYQCPRCSFGPVSHFACPDLTGAPSTNKCPKCSFYAVRIGEWHKWDGQIAEGVLA